MIAATMRFSCITMVRNPTMPQGGFGAGYGSKFCMPARLPHSLAERSNTGTGEAGCESVRAVASPPIPALRRQHLLSIHVPCPNQLLSKVTRTSTNSAPYRTAFLVFGVAGALATIAGMALIDMWSSLLMACQQNEPAMNAVKSMPFWF